MEPLPENGGTPELPGKPKSTAKALLVHLLKLVIAALLIYWVLKDVQWREVASLPRSRLVLSWLSAFVLVFLQSTLSAVRWRMLLKAQGIFISFPSAFSLTFQGIFFSLCLPGGAVGGDVVKAACIVKTSGDKKVEAVTSIFVDRLTGLIALFGLALFLFLLKLSSVAGMEKALQATVLTLAFACAAGLGAAFFILFHEIFLRLSLVRKLVNFADSFLKGAVTRILSAVDIYRKKWKTLLVTCLMGVVIIHPLLFLALYSIAVILTGKAQDLLTVFFSAGMGNVASCIPGTVGGLGARDKVMQLLLETGGLSASDAAMIPILYTLGYVSCSLTGSVCFVADSLLKRRSGKKS